MSEYLVYDCEIKRCLLNKGEVRRPELEYAAHWGDHVGMGISVITAYTSFRDSYYVFLEDNLQGFGGLVLHAQNSGWEVVGFQSKKFDDVLCAAHGINIVTTYDLFVEAKRAAGVGTFAKGYKLDEIAYANLGERKQDTGAHAPEAWQNGKYGHVVNYCLKDTRLTKQLFDKRLSLLDPTDGRMLHLPEWIGARKEVTA